MRFRPCIDIHNGSVKQIVGSSLTQNGQVLENYVSDCDAKFFALKYQKDHLSGGHIILLNPKDSAYYQEDVNQAKKALKAFPGGFQIGGGIDIDNAKTFLNLGASHVIVTSYVFREGQIDFSRLKKLSETVGKSHLVLDLSCKFVGDDYYIVTDRWQKVTRQRLHRETLESLSRYCDEFLVHAADVEGKANGVDREVLSRLSQCKILPTTYAGGVHNMADIDCIREVGEGFLDFTVGSALSLFGGSIPYEQLLCLTSA